MLKHVITAKIRRTIKESLLFTLPKVKVKLNQGTVIGCIEKLPNKNNYQRFSGISYAKPPINALRFKAPQELDKFDEPEIDCSREQDKCFHKSTLTKKFVGSENCLNLNVYTPETSSKKLAVMVFIHGGGFMFDSNSVDL
jgi:carboxylesterase type B